MRRREWIRSTIRGGGVALIALLTGGYWENRERLARHRFAREVRELLAPIPVPSEVIDAYLADLRGHDPAVWARRDDPEGHDTVVGRFLLSTDLFRRPPDDRAPLAYVRYANVYVHACVNPFARFVET